MKKISLAALITTSFFTALIVLSIGCSRDDGSTDSQMTIDPAGTWNIPSVGSFSIEQDQSATKEIFMENVAVDIEESMCTMTGFKNRFDHFAFPNIKDNKIENAMAGDLSAVQGGVVTRPYGFTMFDLKRLDFSCCRELTVLFLT